LLTLEAVQHQTAGAVGKGERRGPTDTRRRPGQHDRRVADRIGLPDSCRVTLVEPAEQMF
jgi:hypothetical protein